MSNEKRFEEIKSIRLSIKNTFKMLTEKHTEIKEQYKKYIEANKKSELLDSFYFQIKIMDYEYNNTEKLYHMIDNRMYCDYYKLFIIVYNYFKNQFKTEKSEMIIKNSKYPVYKDLDQLKIYDFDTVNDIHQDIIRLIDYIAKIIHQNEEEIKSHQVKVSNGLNIDNYIFNLEYRNNLIVNNVSLYKKFLSSYHKYHASFLCNLNDRVNLILEQLKNDVNFTEPIQEHPQILIKMCIQCSMKEADYCKSCMNEERDEYERFAILRDSINSEMNTELEISKTKNKKPIEPVNDEPVIVEAHDVSNVDDLVIVDAPVNEIIPEAIVNGPVIVEEPVIPEPIVEEPVIAEVQVEQVIPESIVEESIIPEPIVNESVIVEESIIPEPIVNDSVIVEEPVAPIIADVQVEQVIPEPIADGPVNDESIIVEEPIISDDPVISEPIVNELIIVENTVIPEPIVEEPVIAEVQVEQVIPESIADVPVIPEPIADVLVNDVPVIPEPIVNESIIVEDPVIPETIADVLVNNVPVIPEPIMNDPVIPDIANNYISDEPLSPPPYFNDEIDEPININLQEYVSPIQLSTIIEQNDNDESMDIEIDNITNTEQIERKIHTTSPFFIDLELVPANELSHPHQRRKKNNKKGHKK